MLLAFLVMGIYPAGENQIAVIDMYHQYVPFLGELQSKLQSGGSLFYTWNGAGGSNFWNLLAYYGASPLNLILVLFPKKFLMEGVTSDPAFEDRTCRKYDGGVSACHRLGKGQAQCGYLPGGIRDSVCAVLVCDGILLVHHVDGCSGTAATLHTGTS